MKLENMHMHLLLWQLLINYTQYVALPMTGKNNFQ